MSEGKNSPDPDSTMDSASAHDFPIVGIGASAGGLEALEQFFGAVPSDTGMAFVVVQHLSPDFKSLMDELLARYTTMEIHRVVDGVEVQPNSIYLIPPKTNMMFRDGKLRLTEHLSSDGLRYPIDIFFISLAENAGSRSVAVVLSGTGSDGSRGITEVHNAGGFVLAQDTESAGFDGMPRAAAATGIADVIGPPKLLPGKIVEFTRNPDSFVRGQTLDENLEEHDGDIFHLFRVFKKEFGIDFALYKSNTINRRVERRMQLDGFESLPMFISELENDQDLLETLYRDLLVEVTQFFRDKEAFRLLENQVFPELLRQSEQRKEIRVWVPGCATGEEAYSIAILLREAAAEIGRHANVKIFASDVHQRSLEVAGSGVYSSQAISNVPESLRDKYFIPEGESYRVNPEIRQMVVFAKHDITSDPPFTKIDFLSCRNVLIYLEQEVQRRVIAMFHFALKTGGVMLLGPSETTAEYSKEFDSLDPNWRLFRKLRDIRLPEVGRVPMNSPLTTIVHGKKSTTNPALDDTWMLPAAYEQLLSKYVPPSLLVNEFYDIVHTFGEARKLLVQPVGKPSLNLLKMVEGKLKSVLSAGLHHAGNKKTAVSHSAVEVETPEGPKPYRVIVEPCIKGTRKLFLVTFDENVDQTKITVNAPADTVALDGNVSDRALELEQELDYTRESLQATVEELETSNEELQSTNEELVASNEELQSTNEELHSVNEELHTVNSEHQRKIAELLQANNDLNNFVSSSDTGTIFLDQELRIRRFTPSISKIFNVLDQDVGRPISHIAYHLDSPDLLEDAESVLKTGQRIDREISGPDGKVFFKKIQPYANSLGEIEGVVLSFTDISPIKLIEQSLNDVKGTLSSTESSYQEFAYAVSHDLLAPMRHLKMFCDSLDENAQEFDFNKIRTGIKDSVDRLELMVHSLLEYSRVESRGGPFTQFSLDEVIEEVILDHREALDLCGGQVTHEMLPHLYGDPKQIHHLFWHLLDNAIKYRSNKDLKIHIGAKKLRDQVQITVDDNGIGIEERHRDRIFVMFQRLGIKTETDGNGVGLALCARITDRHNGAIWCESIFGEGTSIFVRLPAAPEQNES